MPRPIGFLITLSLIALTIYILTRPPQPTTAPTPTPLTSAPALSLIAQTPLTAIFALDVADGSAYVEACGENTIKAALAAYEALNQPAQFAIIISNGQTATDYTLTNANPAQFRQTQLSRAVSCHVE